jgi:hypothetical protein
MKVETAEKLAKDLENNSDNNANKNLSGNFVYYALQNYNETRTNPAYSYLSDNIHYKDFIWSSVPDTEPLQIPARSNQSGFL